MTPQSATPTLPRPLWLLTSADLQLLARVDGSARTATPEPERLAHEPDRVVSLLGDPRAFAAVFGERAAERYEPRENPSEAAPTEPLVGVSPFLVFAVAVHRAPGELAATGYVHEWVGPRQRIPVFDGGELADFLGTRERRLFLAELLASYTRVASGAFWRQTHRGRRRQRFSELDPARLASLLTEAPEHDQPGIYRRLGDLALFLTGVFPDHTSTYGVSAVDAERLTRTLPGATTPPEAVDALATRGSVGLLETLGPRWYRLAAETGAHVPELTTVAGRFVDARRVLNHVTDRHLFGPRGQWFPAG